MRRRVILAAILFLTLASCFYRPVYIPEEQGRLGGGCREINRIRCAVQECRGANMDHVTYQCGASRAVSRCVANFRCKSD